MRLARTISIAAVTVTAMGALGATAFGDDTKPDGPRLPEGVTVPAPPEPLDEGLMTQAPDAFTVPVAAPGGGCPGGEQRFDNPVLGYRLCVPGGWGFTDFRARDPLTSIPSDRLASLHLIGPDAFPWRPGTAPFDAIATAGLVDIELNILEAGASAATDCTPATRERIGSAIARTCVQHYDALGMPAALGPVRALKVELPLSSTPLRTDALFDPTGASLQIIVRTALTDLEGAKLAWRIVESIRAL